MRWVWAVRLGKVVDAGSSSSSPFARALVRVRPQVLVSSRAHTHPAPSLHRQPRVCGKRWKGHPSVRGVEKRQREPVNAPRPGGKPVACFASATQGRRANFSLSLATYTARNASPSPASPSNVLREDAFLRLRRRHACPLAPSAIHSRHRLSRAITTSAGLRSRRTLRRDVGGLRLLNADTGITQDRPIEEALSTPWHRFATPATISAPYQFSRRRYQRAWETHHGGAKEL